jgi:hypothetical protein
MSWLFIRNPEEKPMKAVSRNVMPLAVLSVLGCILLTPYVKWAQMKPRVTIEFNNNTGLSSLTYNGTKLLKFGDFRVVRVMIRNNSGDPSPADLKSTLSVVPAKQVATRTFGWGTVSTHYEAKGNRLFLTVTTTNKSTSTIEAVSYEPLGFAFPDKVVEYDGSAPLLGNNVGNPTLITLSYKDGVVVLANEDVKRPLLIGFPWALDRPANTVFPLRIETGRDPMLPDALPYIDRPIAPGDSDVFTVSLRFGPRGASGLTLGGDVLQRFAKAFPSQLQWRDRRPVGTVTLASSGLNSPTNPRGWFQDPKLDVNTEEGRADFRRRVLQTAQSTISVLREMNAQGMITWDIEGQQYPQATYAGDPRVYATMAPEMADVADEYFRTVRDAGFRAGVCVRPQEIVFDAAHKNAYERDVQDPGQVLMEKIAWARHHWGATLFYVQYNGAPGRPFDADILQRIAAEYPDILLIPEHANLRYYAFSAPYFSLTNGLAFTPAPVKVVYPNAFSFINTADTQITNHHDDLAAAVKQGDVLMYRTWYDDPANTELKTLYQ